MKKRITEVLGIDTLPNYWDRRYVKNLDRLSRPVYEVERHEDVWMTLRDGVRLCVDVYLPKGAGPVPALVSWSAYSKEMQNIKRGAIPPESLLFDHSLEAGEVDDGINLVVGEDLVHGGAVADVGFDEGHLLADNLLDAADGFGLRVHKVVHDHYRVACLVQLYKGVAADVAGATSKQNVHIVKGLDS